ncbi:hypothetical protein BH23BAC1_BH23BAC1_20470 [soil metagenome]
MRVTFKDVGSGDTIFLEWKHEGVEKYGIIDCKLKNHKNPILNQLKQLHVKEIEFIILSHPHYDHYSGLNSLLDYCENKGITIKLFGYTSYTIPESLQMAVRGHIAKRDLERLFQRMNALHIKGIIEEIGHISSTTRVFILSENLNLEILAPTTKDLNDYNSRKYRNLLDIKRNYSDANLLSTFIRIYSDKWSYLLTSDTWEEIYKRFLQKKVLQGWGEVIFGQISHHGANENYFHHKFWKALTRKKDSPTIISVGKNSYGHPSMKVINSLENFGYKVFTTQILSSTTENIENIDDLDLISEVNSDDIGEDVIIDIASDGKIEVL